METLMLYKIDDHYVRFLQSRDSKVQLNKNARRPYVGIVLTVGSFRYFVPMESPKPNHANIKAGKHILKLDSGQMGLLGFNNMIPVPDSALISFDINQEADEKYRELLLRQIRLCNRMKAEIFSKAASTYFDVTNAKNKFLVSISCNFKKLETACNQYCPSRFR